MSPDLVRALLVILLALLLSGQAMRALGLRRRAFFFASGGMAAIGLSNAAGALALSPLLVSALAGIGVALLAVGLFLLIRSWRSGELRQEVERYRESAAEERRRKEDQDRETSRPGE